MSSMSTMCSVYDGRQHVGFVLHHLDQHVFEAVDPDNRSHGTYATYREAAAALPCLDQRARPRGDRRAQNPSV